MRYVDGFLIPIPKKNIAAYKRISSQAGKIWCELGALEYRECVGDDMKISTGVGFPSRLRLKRGEAAVFSWIVYRSRAHRDSVNKRIMKDKRILAMMEKEAMPFDVKRMTYGGFRVLVDM
jgi:uncharacterized protein YbaA (DUF1428 family)